MKNSTDCLIPLHKVLPKPFPRVHCLRNSCSLQWWALVCAKMLRLRKQSLDQNDGSWNSEVVPSDTSNGQKFVCMNLHRHISNKEELKSEWGLWCTFHQSNGFPHHNKYAKDSTQHLVNLYQKANQNSSWRFAIHHHWSCFSWHDRSGHLLMLGWQTITESEQICNKWFYMFSTLGCRHQRILWSRTRINLNVFAIKLMFEDKLKHEIIGMPVGNRGAELRSSISFGRHFLFKHQSESKFNLW